MRIPAARGSHIAALLLLASSACAPTQWTRVTTATAVFDNDEVVADFDDGERVCLEHANGTASKLTGTLCETTKRVTVNASNATLTVRGVSSGHTDPGVIVLGIVLTALVVGAIVGVVALVSSFHAV